MEVRSLYNCPICNRYSDYNDEYDVYYCKVCDIWLEDKCSDPNCEFCVYRPEKPSSFTQVIYSEGRKKREGE